MHCYRLGRIAFCLILTLVMCSFSTTLYAAAPLSLEPQGVSPQPPFIGRVQGRKIRMRIAPAKSAQVVREFAKEELVSVVGAQGDFWIIEPPSDVRGYLLTALLPLGKQAVVNLRLTPDIEAPIIGQISADEIVDLDREDFDSTWLALPLPEGLHFFVAKEFVAPVGRLSDKDRLLAARERLLERMELITTQSLAELNKPFVQIEIDRICQLIGSSINEFIDFPEHIHALKKILNGFQEAYLVKRVEWYDYLLEQEDAQIAAEHRQEVSLAGLEAITDKMRLWEVVEQERYSEWLALKHPLAAKDASLWSQFYEEEKLKALALTGIVEPYSFGIKNRPGDYLLKDRLRDIPIAYLYSMRVNLEELRGKLVTLIVLPRPNNHFALPAYCVFNVESQ